MSLYRMDGKTRVAELTSSKMDWTISSYTGVLTYKNQVHCERFGNIVCVTMNSVDGDTLPDSGTSLGKLPIGYRPTTAVTTVCRYGTNLSGIDKQYIDNVGFLTVNADGTVSWGLSTVPKQSQRWVWSISYITNDVTPSHNN